MYLIHKGDDAMADKTLLSGSTTLLVLSLLSEGDKYGYEMIAELDRRSDHTFALKEGTLYPILHALEKGKYLSSYQQEAPTGRVRKYYAITPRGREFLNYAQKNGAVVSLSDELPQSYVLADGAVVDTVYLSELSPAAMRRRAEKMIE